ncbi:MAG: prepilin-type N-terminal cleavage/methylation domain-containing protein [Deltaproteobacteria bacterium]|nr:prepilin-type N-terminal cleavage/methylation domain-containing protein [Deltaproteobacteria bacterium]
MEVTILCRHLNNDSYNIVASRGKYGFTLLEIVIALTILAIAIIPILNAYAPAIFSAAEDEKTAVFTNQVRGTISRVMTLDFQTLSSNQGDPVDLVSLFGSAEEAAKETCTFNGKAYTPSVAISDASSAQGGLLELTVTLEQVSLKTLKAQY